MADNSSRKFKFISPGVFTKEIDNSQLPAVAGDVGPVIIGKSQKGPGMKPITVSSFNEFVEIFGAPVAGNEGEDIWRDNSLNVPTYGAYAAQAWLDSSTPLTYLRLMGEQSPDATTADLDAGGYAGWRAGDMASTNIATPLSGGAWGLVVFPSGSLAQDTTTKASGTNIINLGTAAGSNGNDDDDNFNITVPVGLGGAGAAVNVKLVAALGVPAGNDVHIVRATSNDTNRTRMLMAVNGSTFPGFDATKVSFAGDDGVLGVSASVGSTDSEVTLEADVGGVLGNSTILANVVAKGSTLVQFSPMAGGAYSDTTPMVSGAVGAILYATEGRIVLSGTTAGTLIGGGSTATASACEMYESDSNGNLTLLVSKDGTVANSENVQISLNPASNNFIRNVLNTNPTVTNTAITPESARSASEGGNYWVGETFERSLLSSSVDTFGVLDGGNASSFSSGLDGKFHAMLLPLRNQASTTDNTLNDRRYSASRATTGYYFSQDLSTDFAVYNPKNMQKLFRFEALAPGEEVQREIKISVENIKAPEGAFEDYGSFSVIIRSMNDSDANPVILERFDSLTLNPASPNYIGVVIGDRYEKYDSTIQGNRQYGQYPNNSSFIRVEVDESIARGGAEPRYLPFGVFGPLTYRQLAIVSGSDAPSSPAAAGVVARGTNFGMLDGGDSTDFGSLGGHAGINNDLFSLGADVIGDFTGTVTFPSVPLRQKSTWATPKNRRVTYWGAWTGQTTGDQTFNDSLYDMLRGRCRTLAGPNVNAASTAHDLVGENTLITSDPLQIAWAFSLDNLSGTNDGSVTYESTYRVSGTSISAASSSYESVLTAGLDRFTTVMAGGTTGYDILERDNFRNTKITAVATDEQNSALYSMKTAINIVSDPEHTECNLVSMPGTTVPQVNTFMLETAENRGDCLAVIDIANVYLPDTENANSAEARNAYTIAQAVTGLRNLQVNNSYGATYYPWVRVQDTITNRTLWAPPSVAAIGALSTTDRVAAPWFAPAGFTRGGLSEGAAGIPVLDTSRRLTSDERDTLYEGNINPIAKFPAEGIVIFGQKTLQQTASALDRINVRRLMIYLKREISFIASRLLFAPNTQDTWTRFTQQATPLLDSVKSQFGIEDFRLILDETTTTPDLVDRNIIYAKLIVKPTRSAEFFAIDFVITNSGAGFED
jgi:hypothetical protein